MSSEHLNKQRAWQAYFDDHDKSGFDCILQVWWEAKKMNAWQKVIEKKRVSNKIIIFEPEMEEIRSKRRNAKGI
jgi:hypothetical protein